MSRRDPAVAGQTGEVRERAVRLEVVVLGCEVEIGLARAYSREPIVDAGKQRDAIAATAHRGEALAEAAGLVHGAGDGIGPGGRKAQLFETGCEARRRDALVVEGAAEDWATAVVAAVAAAAAAPVDFRNSRRSMRLPRALYRGPSNPIGSNSTTPRWARRSHYCGGSSALMELKKTSLLA